jgi:hypothetical protein
LRRSLGCTYAIESLMAVLRQVCRSRGLKYQSGAEVDAGKFLATLATDLFIRAEEG